MEQVTNPIGIDLSSKTFTVSLYHASKGASPSIDYSNDLQGFESLEGWLVDHQIHPKNSVLCMENTGVYGEALCHYFHTKEYRIVVEAPQKTKRAFHCADKTDSVDAQQLGEYAHRYYDQLRLWKPLPHLVEQLSALLTTREQLVKQKTMNGNLLLSMKRKVIIPSLIEPSLKIIINELKTQIKTIEKEIHQLFEQHPSTQQEMTELKSLTGVGELLAANFFVYTRGFEKPLQSKKLAARLGIAPRTHQSGTSVRGKPKSRGEGHRRLRKLLYLAAMTARTHNPKFEKYFHQKVAQGKPPTLILNNIQNKLLKIMCALINSKVPYDKNFQSVNPVLLKKVA